MPRVTHVKSARKDNQVCKKGESYFWWKFRYGGKRYSLTRPRPSQLTQSAYYGTLYALQEEVEDTDISDANDFEGLVDTIRDQLEELGQETQDSLDNMPESLQYSPTGELLQERVDAVESAASDIEGIDELDEFDEEDFEREDFEREDFDGDKNDKAAIAAHEEEQDVMENDHEFEQDELESDHEQDQSEDKQAEFDAWKEEAISTLVEAIDSAVV